MFVAKQSSVFNLQVKDFDLICMIFIFRDVRRS